MITAHEALRQCVEAMKLVDFADCAEHPELWHKLNAAQQVAEEVLKRPEQEPAAYIRACGLDNLKAGRTAVVYPCYTDSDQSFCLYAAPVAAQQAAAVPEGYSLVRTDALHGAFNLVDPPPVEHDGKLMVFVNPNAASVLTSLSAAVRYMVTSAAPQPAAAPSGDVGRDRYKPLVVAVREAILTYYDELSARQHGGVAQDKALNTIQEAFGMYWQPGIDHRAITATKDKP